jgi:hypothetical protein
MASKRSRAGRKTAPSNKTRAARAASGERYTPTEAESEAARFVIEKRKQPRTPRFRVTSKDGNNVVFYDHPDKPVAAALMAYTLGTGDGAFCDGMLKQLVNVAGRGNTLEAEDLNFVVSMVRGIAPKDPTEALLATQMAAIHNVTMRAARQLAHAESIDHQDSASTMLNKLARTFTAQIEALKKYRASGEQTIKVQHVTVNDGGQAIVGNVNTGGRVPTKSEGQSHEPDRTAEPGSALRGHIEAVRLPLPGACDAGEECVPVPRRTGGSAEGKS